MQSVKLRMLLRQARCMNEVTSGVTAGVRLPGGGAYPAEPHMGKRD